VLVARDNLKVRRQVAQLLNGLVDVVVDAVDLDDELVGALDALRRPRLDVKQIHLVRLPSRN